MHTVVVLEPNKTCRVELDDALTVSGVLPLWFEIAAKVIVCGLWPDATAVKLTSGLAIKLVRLGGFTARNVYPDEVDGVTV